MFEQGFHDEVAVVGHIAHHKAQQVVHLACQGSAFHHLGPGLYAGAEYVHRIAFVAFGMLFKAHVDVRRETQADRFGLDQSHVAGDDTRLLQALDPAQHGAGGKANLL